MYKSYHYDNMPQPAAYKPPHHSPPQPSPEPCPIPRSSNVPSEQDGSGGILHNFFGGLKNDDVILLVVIFILLLDDCEDKLLLAALGFIFFSGLGDK